MIDGSTDRLKKGVAGGLLGGAVFGLMMSAMGMLPMIGSMIDRPNVLTGLVVHMIMSAGIGALLALYYRSTPNQ